MESLDEIGCENRFCHKLTLAIMTVRQDGLRTMNVKHCASVVGLAKFWLTIVMLYVAPANAAEGPPKVAQIISGDMFYVVPANGAEGPPKAADIVTGRTPSGIEFKILTNNGLVAFTADSDWSVIAAQPRLPVAVMAFQILNTADDGTPDSTNLAISLYGLGVEEGRDAFARSTRKWGQSAPSVETIGPWRVLRQEARQGSTNYTVLDAQRSDIAVSVRLAWPHLSNNTATYDSDMEAIFRHFIASVYGRNGPYSPKEGEIIRRPVK
jgi:hypothetical protein